ncbi:MAG: hypothetical protein HYS27_15235 [Deltaproteobacteria bacterium]|nr:hypothetical protein [Deltaproteobacteria bacterium]
MSVRPYLFAAAILAASCTGDKAAGRGAPPATAATPSTTPLDAPPAAVRVVDAPGLNVEDLTARVRDALARDSGLEVVDELSVRRELAACTEAPCPDELAVRFRDARYLVASSVSRLGSTFLASVRVQDGPKEIARANAEDPDARVAAAKAGAAAGAQVRRVLLAAGVAERVRAPDAVGGAGAGTERDEGPGG